MRKLVLLLGLVSVLCGSFSGCKKSDDGDGVKPVVVVLGYNPVYWALDLPYVDAGALAYDITSAGDTLDLTADIQAKIEVDVTKEGEYQVTYNVKDQSGLAADEQVRVVKVVLGK
ncbi:MAG: DUF5011 domain-containing protein [Bacteroidetes bacterium]|nr:DUF5011 domain-containing protein [Bacteroidota bacterium]